MKIISLNTWGGVMLDDLLGFLRSHQDCDVFCLQEVYSNAEGKEDPHPTLPMKLDLFERIAEVLRETHVGYFRPSYRDFYGQAIFVRKEFSVWGEGDLVIYENLQPIARGTHSRNLQYVRLRHGEGELIVVNVHGLWNGKGKGDTPERLAQSQVISNFIKSVSGHVIMVGDFNLNPDTKSIALLEESMRNLIREYRVPSTRTALYEGDNPFADYVFVSPQVEVRDFLVLPDQVSDHAALLLDIQ